MNPIPDNVLKALSIEMTKDCTKIIGAIPIGFVYLPQFSVEVSEMTIVNHAIPEWSNLTPHVSLDMKLSNGETVAVTMPHMIAHAIADTMSRFEGVSE